jgi:hypothetical protein
MELKLLNASNKGTLTPGKAVKRTVVLFAGGMTAATLQFPEVHRAQSGRRPLRSVILDCYSTRCRQRQCRLTVPVKYILA